MRAVLHSFDKVIAVALNVLALGSSALVVGLILLLVVSRYVFNWSIVGLHELSLLFVMWLYMGGALIASRRREHLVVDFLSQKIESPRGKALQDLLVSAISLGITLAFIYWTYRMLAWGFKLPQTTPALDIPLYVPQFAIAVAAVGCASYALRDLIRAIAKLSGRATG